MNNELPSWNREALEQGIDYIILVYGKAEGFVFCPSNLEKPFRVGGDYDGNWHVTADGALEYCQKYLHKAYNEPVLWFVPYIEMILDDQDFSLSELEKDIEQRDLRVIKGRWPW